MYLDIFVSAHFAVWLLGRTAFFSECPNTAVSKSRLDILKFIDDDFEITFESMTHLLKQDNPLVILAIAKHLKTSRSF